MIQSLLILALPVVLLVDVTFLFTWLTMMALDGYGIPKRITVRGLLIAFGVIAVHAVVLTAFLSDPPNLEKLPLEKLGDAFDITGPN